MTKNHQGSRLIQIAQLRDRLEGADGGENRSPTGLFGAALALEIGGCRDGQDARIEELSCHKTGRSRFTKSDREVESVGDHISELVFGDQFQSELRVLINK